MRLAKKVEGFRWQWLYVDTKGSPTSPAVRSSGWGHERLADPRLARVWKKLAELRAVKVMVVMIVQEFL